MKIFENNTLTLFKSVLYQTVTTIIKTKDSVVVVDPCWLPHEVEEIRDYVDLILNNRPLYLLFTHSDFDHIIGYKAFPDAKVIASSLLAIKSEVEKNEIIEEIKAFDDEYYLVRNYEIAYPEVDYVIEDDGDTLVIGDTKLVFYNAPGHTVDGIFTIVEPLGVFIAGDYFSNIEFPFIYDSSIHYEKTMLKLDSILNKHDIKLLITGHGDFTENVSEMRRRQQESLNYIYAMRKLVEAHDQKEIDDLITNYKFPRNMKKSHKNNQNLFENELKNKNSFR